MNITSSDAKQSISLGGSDTWQTLCSTILYHLAYYEKQIPHVFAFIKEGHSNSQDCLSTAREFNLVRDRLSQIEPEQIIYDYNEPEKQPPWGDKISPVITSCANYLTTGDGDDLLAEIVKILTYAAYVKASVDVK